MPTLGSLITSDCGGFDHVSFFTSTSDDYRVFFSPRHNSFFRVDPRPRTVPTLFLRGKEVAVAACVGPMSNCIGRQLRPLLFLGRSFWRPCPWTRSCCFLNSYPSYRSELESSFPCNSLLPVSFSFSLPFFFRRGLSPPPTCTFGIEELLISFFSTLLLGQWGRRGDPLNRTLDRI